MGDQNQGGRQADHREVAPVPQGQWPDADQDVAGNAAGEADDRRQDQDAEEVEPGSHGGDRTAQGEGEGPRQVEHEQQRRLSHGCTPSAQDWLDQWTSEIEWASSQVAWSAKSRRLLPD
jgi:hypothetical protein